MTPEALLQLTRELVASPHFSYQPQMRLRNGAILLETDERCGVYVYHHRGPQWVVLPGSVGPQDGIATPLCFTDDWLPDLEDDGTVGVLWGMMCTAWGADAHVEIYPNQGRARVDVITLGHHYVLEHDTIGYCVAKALIAAPPTQ